MNMDVRKEVLAEVRKARYALNRTWHLAVLGSGEDPELERVVVGAICSANAQLWTATDDLVRLAEDEEGGA